MLTPPSGGVLARGYARSYGDVCLNGDGRILDTTRFAGIESFDAASGVLVCKAGTSYRAIMKQCLPQGWLPPVCPGTAFVSMGGGIANDVHGKNQHVVGSFGDHVDWFDLRVPGGQTVRVTRGSEPELYAATTGGIGLTGVIERLQMPLQAAPSNAMELREERIPDIDTFLDRLRSTESEYTHAVGWLDCVTSGRHMGRGILELARPSAEGVRHPLPFAVSVPFEFPKQVLNRMTVQMFNAVYLRRVPLSGRERLVHVDKFLYPLDAIHNWNRMYGRSGVYQFQCVMPFEDGRRAIITLMEEIVRSRGASFLAVLKSMNRTGWVSSRSRGPGSPSPWISPVGRTRERSSNGSMTLSSRSAAVYISQKMRCSLRRAFGPCTRRSINSRRFWPRSIPRVSCSLTCPGGLVCMGVRRPLGGLRRDGAARRSAQGN